MSEYIRGFKEAAELLKKCGNVVAFSASIDNRDPNLSHEIIILDGAEGLKGFGDCVGTHKSVFEFTLLRINNLTCGDIWPGKHAEMVKKFVKPEWKCTWMTLDHGFQDFSRK